MSRRKARTWEAWALLSLHCPGGIEGQWTQNRPLGIYSYKSDADARVGGTAERPIRVRITEIPAARRKKGAVKK